jgi:hypothetical protein
MSFRFLLLSASMFLVSATGNMALASADPQTLAERADAQAEKITDADAFVAEIDQALVMAQKGAYGTLSKKATFNLHASRDVIANLLKGHANALELKPDDRIAVYNAQEEITAILRNKDKYRMVCRKEQEIGTRVQTTMCMTVGEREARAKAAAESTTGLQRETCVPGETSSCGKN